MLEEATALLKNGTLHLLGDLKMLREGKAKTELDVLYLEQLKETVGRGVAMARRTCTGKARFLPSRKKFGLFQEASKAEQIKAMEQELELRSKHVAEAQKQASKLESRMALLTGGYSARAEAQKQSIKVLAANLQEMLRQLQCFRGLYANEEKAIPMRTENLRQEVSHLQEQVFKSP